MSLPEAAAPGLASLGPDERTPAQASPDAEIPAPADTPPDPEDPAAAQSSLDGLVAAVRSHPGLRAKRAIAAVRRYVETADPVGGPGDDGATVTTAAAGSVIVCGEAVHPDFVAADPRGAGIAAVLANVNDLAAMGAVPRGIVNTVVASAPVAAEALAGMAEAARLYDVAIVGGHITEHEGQPALSAFAVGDADEVLSVSRACAGQHLVFACCLDGRMRADFDFFTTLSHQGPRLARDVRLLAAAARDGLAAAAKDVSMAGSIGSLAMLLEPGKLGAEVDLDRLPAPAGVRLDQWLVCFPTFAFWLTTDRPSECVELFASARLAAAACGTVTDTGVLVLRRGAQSRDVIDIRREPVTGLWA